MARVQGESAREHIRNALAILQNSGLEEVSGGGLLFEDEDVGAIEDRLTWALDEIKKGNA